MTQNWFATFALLLWPVITLWLYGTRPAWQATLWTFLFAHLLLPAGAAIKLAAGIPQLDKISIPSLAALAGCLLFVRRPLRFRHGFGLAEVLITIFLIAPFITAELNNDPIHLVNAVLPAESHYDALSSTFGQFLFFFPFFLGRQLLRRSADNAEILRILVIAGLLYSVPMLFEVRMSPQLNYWIYGYYPSAFIMTMRDGGFRPMVFMANGLLTTFFAMTTAVAAAALWRTHTRVWKLAPAAVTAYLSAVLVLYKSLGSLLYCAALVPLVRWTKPRLQLRIALMFAIIALLYPMLRVVDLVPTKTMVDAAALISQSRADSLQTRFDQEQQLLQRASERFLFGWGRFGRSRVYDSNTGRDISLTDGDWIITLGTFGLVGFLAQFGLLALPVFRAALARRFTSSMNEQVFLAALALILGIFIIDQLPNSSTSPWTWLLAGALLGRAEELQTGARSRSSVFASMQQHRAALHAHTTDGST